MTTFFIRFVVTSHGVSEVCYSNADNFATKQFSQFVHYLSLYPRTSRALLANLLFTSLRYRSLGVLFALHTFVCLA